MHSLYYTFVSEAICAQTSVQMEKSHLTFSDLFGMLCSLAQCISFLELKEENIHKRRNMTSSHQGASRYSLHRSPFKFMAYIYYALEPKQTEK